MVMSGVVLAGLLAWGVVSLTRSLPPVRLLAAALPHSFDGRLRGLGWPAQGQAAVGVDGVGLIGSHGPEPPTPIASVTKVMTAYVVLSDHPLGASSSGPEIAVTPADVAVYEADRATGQSTARVRAGEVLSEREALEALLLPSGNNVATLLARWDAGSEQAFVDKMNDRAHALGMNGTHYADASGFNTDTVSTARDQVRLAMRALRVPALAQIVALRKATVPVAGELRNLDELLGSHGIVGVKTGNTSAAGGCFMFAARELVGRRPVLVIGAVLGQPASLSDPTELDGAFAATTTLLASVHHRLRPLSSLLRGRALGHVSAQWAHAVPVRASRLPPVIGWAGMRLQIRIRPVRHLAAPIYPGQLVGIAVVHAGSQRARFGLVAVRGMPEPSLGWRLTHP